MVSVVVLSQQPSAGLFDDLNKQTYQDFEIIVAKEKGIVNAMNIALDKAKGDIFIRIDDDVELDPNWLEELIKPFNDPQVAGATGPTIIPKEKWKNRDSINFFRTHSHKLFWKWLFDDKPYEPAKIYKCGSVSYASNFAYTLGFRNIEVDHLEGTNWAMRTDLIRKVGGFDPKFDGVAEWFDTDVEFKIKKLGYKLMYRSQAMLWHNVEKGPTFNERFEGWGRIKNWLRFHWRHSKFHPKMIIWLFLMIGYTIWKKYQS